MRTWKCGAWMMVWAVFTTGCETDRVGPAAGPTDAEPRAIALVSGDGQKGKAGEILDEPLIVQVTGAGGQPFADVRVRWQIVGGAGALRTAPSVTGAAGELTTSTNADGLARVYVEPQKLGTFAVRARPLSGSAEPVTFTAEVATLVISILEGWSFCASGYWCQPVPIPVGTVIEWVNRDVREHTVTSSTTPPGGAPFDSGTLEPGARFQFVPDVAGTWEYFDRILGADVLSSQITAR